LQNGFVWDDQQQIVMNPELRPHAEWSSLFSNGVWAHLHQGAAASNIYYRPLQMATYRLVIGEAGASPFALHAVSVMFAVVSVLLAFGLFWKITGNRNVAFAAAALFAVHPIHTEAVDWISALPDIGCTIFVLAGFLFFLFASDRGVSERNLRWLSWGLSLACFALALLWKETAAVVPLLIGVYVLLTRRDTQGHRIKAAALLSLPFWLVLCGYLLLRLRLLETIAATQRNWQLSPSELALTLPFLMAQYCWKLIAPVGLNAYHLFTPVTSVFELRALAAALFLVLALAFLVYTTRRLPLAAFGAAWVIITLLPVMDIYAVGRNVFAERYLYLPSVGYCLLVVVLAVQLLGPLPTKQQKLVGAVSLILVVSVFAGTIVAANSNWKDNATLFTRTLELSPQAPFVQIMVAAAMSEHSGSSGEAEEHYRKAAEYAAAEVPPDRTNLAIADKGLASIYSERGEYDRALAMLAKAREASPNDTEIDGEQGLILTKAGRWDDAAVFLKRAAAVSGDDANVRNALGLYEMGRNHDYESAVQYFRQALAIHTAQDAFAASVHNNLGTAYGEQGRYGDAIEQFKSAIASAPDDPEFHMNLATALAASGQPDAARAELTGLLVRNPGYAPARQLMTELNGR
jgi:protein O-mannosyl-transferase